MSLTVFTRQAVPSEDVSEIIERELPAAEYKQAWDTITHWSGYQPSPLVDVADIADQVGVGELWVKDESHRLGLNSFKSLGGAYAVERALHDVSLAGDDNQRVTVTCASDGNHGLSVAWGAQQLGHHCIIYVPHGVSDDRVGLIEAMGAQVVRIDANYDDTSRINAADAEKNGWRIITDTAATPDSELQSPRDVMQGYRVLAEEIVKQYGDDRPTHVLLQAGCGGMAAAVIGHLVYRWGFGPLPTFITVEPCQAACVIESLRHDKLTTVSGDLETAMIGLSVGEVSTLAWDILHATTTGAIAIPDRNVAPATELLNTAGPNRAAIDSGETGAAAVAALLDLSHNATPADLQDLNLDHRSRVLVINTEGHPDNFVAS